MFVPFLPFSHPPGQGGLLLTSRRYPVSTLEINLEAFL